MKKCEFSGFLLVLVVCFSACDTPCDPKLGQMALEKKIEEFKRLSPSGGVTDLEKERQMECLILSVKETELSQFKFELEYDGDYKDMVEYVFHDIDAKEIRTRIIEHLSKAPSAGVKVLTDVDDTMYPNLIDDRYPKKVLYPGVLEFYDALKEEALATKQQICVTTLSARPAAIKGVGEELSLRGLRLKHERLYPSALSGELSSSFIGTMETWLRDKLDPLSDWAPHGQEDEIGKVKFENFLDFAQVYREYRYVFVGDSGQGDANAAQLMLTKTPPEDRPRVIATFIHDLGDTKRSKSFEKLDPTLKADETTAPGPAGAVIIFRNYIQAAVIAYKWKEKLTGLITETELAAITKAALKQVQNLNEKQELRDALRGEYQADAKKACGFLIAAQSKDPDLKAVCAKL